MNDAIGFDMARPTKFDKINHDALRAAAASCGTLDDIAGALRLSVRCLHKARESDPEIDLVIAEARAAVGQAVANKLLDAAMNGSVEAQRFILERKFGWQKTSKTELELQGKANMPQIQITLQSADPTIKTLN